MTVENLAAWAPTCEGLKNAGTSLAYRYWNLAVLVAFSKHFTIDRPSGDTTMVGTTSSWIFPLTSFTRSFWTPSTYDTTRGRYLRGVVILPPLKSVLRSRSPIMGAGGGRRNGNVNGFSPRMNDTYSWHHPRNRDSASGVLNDPSVLKKVVGFSLSSGLCRLSFHRNKLKNKMISWNESYIGVAVKSTRVIPFATFTIR